MNTKFRVIHALIFCAVIVLTSTTRELSIASANNVRIPFIALEEKVSDNALFYTDIAGGSAVILCEGEIVYRLSDSHGPDIQGKVIVESILNGKPFAIQGDSKACTSVNRFRGNTPGTWQSDIPTYHEIAYGEVYPRIRLTLKATKNSVEKLFHVAPEGNPDEIRVRLDPVRFLSVNAAGELVASTEGDDVRFTKPIAFQEIDGKRIDIDIKYTIDGNEYGFDVGAYDPTETLIIDPLISSTYLGGSGMDGDFGGPEFVLDADDNIFYIGITQSPDLPTTSGVIEENYQGDTDLLLAKFSPDMKTLLACTYIGGSGMEDSPRVMVDTQGDVYITGYTSSLDFPTTPGAYNETYNGGDFDCFVLKLTSDLTTIIASTYLGGSDAEGPYGTTLSRSENGRLYVSGGTLSSDFPTTFNAFDTNHNGDNDIFITCLDPDLSLIHASTYLGGTLFETSWHLTPMGTDIVYILGSTKSVDFPVTSGAYDTTFNGGVYDISISKLDADLSMLHASTYLGGGTPGEDVACDLVLDANGNLLTCGHAGVGFPTTPGAFDSTHNNQLEGFVTKISPDLSSLLCSTFMSGTTNRGIIGFSLVLDAEGNIYVGGDIDGNGFPTQPDAFDRNYNGGTDDALVVKYNSDLTTQLRATYLGGNKLDVSYYIALDKSGDVVLSGITSSENFPVSLGAFDEDYNGGTYDLFLSRFDLDLTKNPLVLSKDTISSTFGGTVQFKLHGGEVNAGRNFLILGSISGFEPGHPLPGGHASLPLVWDSFTNSLLLLVNSTVLQTFMSTLDASGSCTSMLYSGPIDPSHVGLTMYFAFCLNEPFDFVSNPVAIEIVP